MSIRPPVPLVQIIFFPSGTGPRRSSAGHEVAHRMLGSCGESLSFAPAGRPLASGNRLDVGISHSQGAGVVSIGRDTLIGVDIARGEWRCSSRFINRICTPSEERWVTGDGLLQDRFKLLWTRKEACLKLWGIGLRMAPSSIDVLAPQVAPGSPGDPPVFLRSWLVGTTVLSLATTTERLFIETSVSPGIADVAHVIGSASARPTRARTSRRIGVSTDPTRSAGPPMPPVVSASPP